MGEPIRVPILDRFEGTPIGEATIDPDLLPERPTFYLGLRYRANRIVAPRDRGALERDPAPQVTDYDILELAIMPDEDVREALGETYGEEQTDPDELSPLPDDHRRRIAGATAELPDELSPLPDDHRRRIAGATAELRDLRRIHRKDTRPQVRALLALLDTSLVVAEGTLLAETVVEKMAARVGT